MPDATVRLTGAAVAAACGGRMESGDPGRAFAGVAIDSRTVSEGQLFIGIRGERFDGSEYAGASVEKGAAGVVVPRGAGAIGGLVRDPRRPVVITVDDTTAALQAIGGHVRRESGTRVTAITGSAGKTTTKEVAAEFLSTQFSVYRNPGNLNNHIGLPLSLIELRDRPEMAVVELGMNHAGEIRQLVSIAEPDMRVWINVGDAHIGFFASAEAIADAKAEILEGATAATVLVANADDARVMSRVKSFPGRVVTFGLGEDGDVRATDVEYRGFAGTAAHLVTPHGEADVETPLVGDANLANVLAATAVAVSWGVPLAQIVVQSARLAPAPRRGQTVPLAGGGTLVDDSYNSSPAALKTALRTLSRDTRHPRRLAFLGEMRELGAHASRLHAECGRTAASSGVDVLVTVGGSNAELMAQSARDAGLAPDMVRHVKTSSEAADLVGELIRPGDLVLVKGSRGVRMDVVADRVREESR